MVREENRPTYLDDRDYREKLSDLKCRKTALTILFWLFVFAGFWSWLFYVGIVPSLFAFIKTKKEIDILVKTMLYY